MACSTDYFKGARSSTRIFNPKHAFSRISIDFNIKLVFFFLLLSWRVLTQSGSFIFSVTLEYGFLKKNGNERFFFFRRPGKLETTEVSRFWRETFHRRTLLQNDRRRRRRWRALDGRPVVGREGGGGGWREGQGLFGGKGKRTEPRGTRTRR